MEVQQDQLQSWIGRSERSHDTIYPTPVVALTATLDHPPAPVEAGTPLPCLWHWLYFLPMHRQSDIGALAYKAQTGELLWHNLADHTQQVTAGYILKGMKAPQVVVNARTYRARGGGGLGAHPRGGRRR